MTFSKLNTISQLARRFGLSRGTLLHYDAIGLLKPSDRSDARYRLYTQADADRLGRICLYRQAGMALADIQRLLDAREPDGYAAILQRRLGDLSEEINTLKRQQRLIAQLLTNHDQKEDTVLNKDQFVALMRATGLTDEDMHRWHREFEKMSGDAHSEFLVSLGCSDEEVKKIREWSRQQ